MSDRPDAAYNHPKHYNEHPSGVEAIDICENLGFNLGNAVKYLFRAVARRVEGGVEARGDVAEAVERPGVPVMGVREEGFVRDSLIMMGMLLLVVIGLSISVGHWQLKVEKVEAALAQCRQAGTSAIVAQAAAGWEDALKIAERCAADLNYCRAQCVK